jgi:hypothetical protein
MINYFQAHSKLQMVPSLTSVIENNYPSEKISEVHCNVTGKTGVTQVNYTPTMVMVAAAAIPAITTITIF